MASDLDSISRELEQIAGVEDVHHIHAWALTSGTNIFSTHVKAHEDADTQAVLKDVHAAIDNLGSFYFATVQVETECVDTPGADDIDIMAGATPDDSHDAHGSMTDHSTDDTPDHGASGDHGSMTDQRPATDHSSHDKHGH